MPVRMALSTSRRASRRQSMVSTSPVFFESRSRCITIFSRTQARTARCSKGVVTVRHLSQPCRPSLRWVELYVAPTGTSTIVTVARALTIDSGKLLLSAADTVTSRPALRSHSSVLPRHRCRRIRPAHITNYPPESSQLCVFSLDLCIPRPPVTPPPRGICCCGRPA